MLYSTTSKCKAIRNCVRISQAPELSTVGPTLDNIRRASSKASCSCIIVVHGFEGLRVQGIWYRMHVSLKGEP